MNQPLQKNTHWTAEIALPIRKLMERTPLAKKPGDGVFWRINFSRVHWGVKQNADGVYEKDPCCQSCATPGSPAEDNWVWSKQGAVAMHLPERWGIVQFQTTAERDGPSRRYEEWPVRCAAMAVYYALVGYREARGSYTTDIAALTSFATPSLPICEGAKMSVALTTNGYEATVTIGAFTAHVNEERYLVVSFQNRLDVTNGIKRK